MDALRHSYTQQKRKVDAMKILHDKAMEINTLFMEEDLKAGKDPRTCEHRVALAAAMSQMEDALLGFQRHLSPLTLLEETPKADLTQFMQPDAEVDRDPIPAPTPEMMEFLPDEDTADAITTPLPPTPSPVLLPGTPNPEIAEDDLPF